MMTKLAIILSALVLLNGVCGSFLNVMNKCNFPIYCLGARSDPPLDTNLYQMELAVNGTSGQSWLDLSIVNGQPFTDYERAAYFPSVGSACTQLKCRPGDHSCEWCPNVGQTTCNPPTYIVCNTAISDAWMYLCSSSGRKDIVGNMERPG
ncbi:hypothetical protein J7T55_007619 [Diaporthe amygdali]|uniref:uncharacterized protein n=1 Tax=Phomopsis amygdali TaxID=1214568 RepID=UPI0022FDE0DD|nr:uncharacterized protein J7T55_007619 [Diaporthe amygdali]KAJ0107249.1 hypothetical protein J7T55_007619 [Diaporthe amygdali]